MVMMMVVMKAKLLMVIMRMMVIDENTLRRAGLGLQTSSCSPPSG